MALLRPCQSLLPRLGQPRRPWAAPKPWWAATGTAEGSAQGKPPAVLQQSRQGLPHLSTPLQAGPHMQAMHVTQQTLLSLQQELSMVGFLASLLVRKAPT